jgi:putative transposase
VIAERWIVGCCRELLDRILIWNQAHLRRILSDYETHTISTGLTAPCTAPRR